ncbi:MAG: PHP domain-containing protein [Clostridia bacterium]|nr:PHP domain-containing protein [Clostridia bacterium]
MKFDLHLHTTASDGTDTPSALVSLAAEKGFELLAITDHDTMSGVREAQEAGKRLGVRVISGVEISAGGDTEVHVLGYAVQKPEMLVQMLEKMRNQRSQRMRQMVMKLNDLGIPIHLGRVTGLAKESVGRSHLARVLVEDGIVRDVREAFNRYLAPGRPAYVEREKLTVSQAVRLIASAGGLPVIAHPGQNHGDAFWMKDRFAELKEAGLKGIEAYHMAHSQQQAIAFARTAKDLGLLVTGGSDYHGTIKNVAIGDGMQYWKTKEADLERFLKAIPESEGL